MDDLRNKFERLPYIAEKLHAVRYDESHNNYHARMVNSSLSVSYVQGAWYAFQEQQKKIDAMSRYLINSRRFEKDEIMELLK